MRRSAPRGVLVFRRVRILTSVSFGALVASLVKTFGSTHSSGVLQYGASQDHRMP